jgi:hypothetical protein
MFYSKLVGKLERVKFQGFGGLSEEGKKKAG